MPQADVSHSGVSAGFYRKVKQLQSGFNRLNTCLKPTIAAVHNRYGGGQERVCVCVYVS